jgi:hypothetical protein
MQNPIPHDDTSSREDNNHIERESTADVGKKGKCMRLKEITLMTLFGMENNLSSGNLICIVTTRNVTRRSGRKYLKELFWKVLFLLRLLLELDTHSLMIHELIYKKVPYQ